MAQITESFGREIGALSGRPPSDKAAAGGVIGAHMLQHFYTHGFYLILPILYTTLALSPAALGFLETVRRVSGGLATMGGGFVLDRFQEKRIMVLYVSLIAMGLGYLLVGVAPTYLIILAAVALASMAGSIWHPAGIGLLSQRYPEQRGLMISLHRSGGSVGDFLGPIVVGALLGVMMWQGILYGALPLSLIFALVLWVLLRNASSWRAFSEKPKERRPVAEQFRSLGGLFKGRGLIMLLLVAGLSGLGQGGLLLWLPTYLQETQGMGSFGQGIHLALLTGMGIVGGPLVGRLSDHVGRKYVIVAVLMIKASIAALMALAGGGILLSVLVGFMGAVMFGVNSLIQAGALDLAEGRNLEGSMIGLLWGSNAVFIGASPLILGFLIGSFGFGVLFWYIAVMNVVAFTAALALPGLSKPARARA